MTNPKTPATVPADDDAGHITQDHDITLTLTRDQFIVLVGALGNADTVTRDGADLTEQDMRHFVESVQTPILQELLTTFAEPAAQALAGYVLDGAEQALSQDDDETGV